jgi:hypothetical protein
MEEMLENDSANGSANDSSLVPWEGRVGTELTSDIWTGSTIKWANTQNEWTSARAVPADTVALDIPKEIRPLQAPPSRPQEVVHAATVREYRAEDDGMAVDGVAGDGVGMGTCAGYLVAGAGTAAVNGCYVEKSGSNPPVFVLDSEHTLYSFNGIWRLGKSGTGVTYMTVNSSTCPPESKSGGCDGSWVRTTSTTGADPCPSVMRSDLPPIAPSPAPPSPTLTLVYSFPTMVVGFAVIKPGSYKSGPTGGNISVQYCERLKNGTAPACEVFTSQYPTTGIRDIHMLSTDESDITKYDIALAPQHTWTGFQHLVVRVTGGATFDGKSDSIWAQWGGAVLESTGKVDGSRSAPPPRLYTIHYTLYTIHYTLYTIHYTLYTLHSTPYTIHYTLYTIHYTLYTIH